MNGYSLNPDLAREGSGRVGGRIQETGKYEGVIEWARELTFPSGAMAIEVKFISKDDENTTFKLWMNSKEPGKPSFGMKQLMALMTCVKVRQIQQVNDSVEVWSRDAGGMAPEPSIVFPELANKPVGLILQKEHDEYDGKPKYQMNLYAPFSIETQQTAKEILDGRNEIGGVDKLAESVKDKYKNNVKQIASSQPTQSTAPASDDFDDDIPF